MMKKVDIDRIAFIGRTYDEYISLFDLDEKLLGEGPVLDCPAGAASFTAESGKLGFNVTACDILYDRNVHQLMEKGKEDIRHIYEKVNEAPQLFTWNYYKDPDNLIAFRKSALDIFAEDFASEYKEGRYRYARLPVLPFSDNYFSLVLSSHFLFLYGDRLSFDFHIQCLKELMRVCSGEVRIYPLTGLDAKPYNYLNDILSSLNACGIQADIVKAPFEFQKGSNKIMKLIGQNDDGTIN